MPTFLETDRGSVVIGVDHEEMRLSRASLLASLTGLHHPGLTSESQAMKRSLRRLLSSLGFMAVALGPGRAWAVTDNFCSFPTTLTTWNLNGNAFEALNTVIRLTDNGVPSELASAFVVTPIPLTATTLFHAYFQFQMGPSPTGGPGLAFVVQDNAAGDVALGASTDSALVMGYGGLTKSLAVVFGTTANTAGNAPTNSVSIVLNGSTTANVKTAVPAFTMAGAGVLSAWVDYTPTGTALSVYLAKGATAAKPGTPLFTYAGSNLFTLLGADMYPGFTSATGTTAATENEHDVYLLELSTDGIPCACEGDAACGGATPACDASGICAVCSATNHSACTGATPVCDVPVNTCVGCLTDANCSGATPICGATLTCRACSSNADCSGSTPYCATSGVNTGECVLCLNNAECSAMNASTPRCSATNACVQCLTDVDCSGTTPACDAAGSCTACATDADCALTPTTPACEYTGACGQCSATNSSQCSGGTGICDYPSGTCVSCEFNTDCAGTTPACNATTHTCQPCATDADCAGNPSGPACATSGTRVGSCVPCAASTDCTSPVAPVCDTVSNQCVQCLASTDCAGTPTTPVCTTSDICVGCLSNADCSGATPVCDATSSACTACQNDYSATNPGPDACPTAALPACQPATSSLAGQCALCSSLNDSACVTLTTTPVCYAPTASCGCNLDTDCNANSYCDSSTVPSGVCTTGCRVIGDAGATNCATGEYCTTTDGSVGTCMTEPCNSNADCKTTADPVCDTIDQPHKCVVCLGDADCPTGLYCDSAYQCVQCTAGHTANCTSAGSGATCLASGTCGCASDADCSGANRVCDPTTHTCATGCHAGGNTCPAGQTCSGADGGTLGSCQTTSTSSSSGGVGGAGGGNVTSTGTGGSGGASPYLITQSIGCGCRVGPGGDGEGDEGRLGAFAGLLAALFVSFQSKTRAR